MIAQVLVGSMAGSGSSDGKPTHLPAGEHSRMMLRTPERETPAGPLLCSSGQKCYLMGVGIQASTLLDHHGIR